MKRITLGMVFFLAGFFWVSPMTAGATDFFESIDYAVANTAIPGVLAVDAQLYGARITGQWGDTNGDRTLDGAELLTSPVRLFDRHGKLVLQSPASVQTEDQLEDWAVANADLILDTLFGGNPSFAQGITSDATINAVTFGDTIFKKVVPKKTAQSLEAADSEFKAAVEYSALDVNDDSGNAGSLVLGWAHSLSNGMELGVTVPYRFTSLDDQCNSESHYSGLVIYLKKDVMQWDDLGLAWNVGGNGFGSVYYLTSDAIDDAGTINYGAGLFTSLIKEFTWGTVSTGVDWKVSRTYLPDSLIDNDDDFTQAVIDWVNDLDPVHSLSYGVNIGIPFAGDSAAVNLEVVRTHFISDDIAEDRDEQTVAGLSFSYFPTETFEINFGVRETFELEDIDAWAVMLGSIYRF